MIDMALIYVFQQDLKTTKAQIKLRLSKAEMNLNVRRRRLNQLDNRYPNESPTRKHVSRAGNPRLPCPAERVTAWT